MQKWFQQIVLPQATSIPISQRMTSRTLPWVTFAASAELWCAWRRGVCLPGSAAHLPCFAGSGGPGRQGGPLGLHRKHGAPRRHVCGKGSQSATELSCFAGAPLISPLPSNVKRKAAIVSFSRDQIAISYHINIKSSNGPTSNESIVWLQSQDDLC